MFKTVEAKQQESAAIGAYRLAAGDRIRVELFSNGGETRPAFAAVTSPQQSETSSSAQNDAESGASSDFSVDQSGKVKLPLIGEHKLDGMTLREAESYLQQEYAKFISAPFLKLTFTNKRVVLLGGESDGEVIQLTNEGVRVTEVLALSKSVGNDAKAHNIRLLRGENVFLIDLSTVEGYRKSNMIVQPDDIIYVEPVRRPLPEGLRDNGPVFSIIASLTALAIVLVNSN